jgi:hypothetical protein
MSDVVKIRKLLESIQLLNIHISEETLDKMCILIAEECERLLKESGED